MIRSVTVFCSAREKIDRVYFTAATDLGSSIAANGWTLVYGGNAVGLMKAVADAAREQGGKVVGITPQLMVDQGIADQKCDELIVTKTMGERKAILERRGDAFVILPGGLGTFEELFEILVGKQLKYHDKPIIFLNTANYYGPLLAMIEHGIEHHFVPAKARNMYEVAATVAETIDCLKRCNDNPLPTDISAAAE